MQFPQGRQVGLGLGPVSENGEHDFAKGTVTSPEGRAQRRQALVGGKSPQARRRGAGHPWCRVLQRLDANGLELRAREPPDVQQVQSVARAVRVLVLQGPIELKQQFLHFRVAGEVCQERAGHGCPIRAFRHVFALEVSGARNCGTPAVLCHALADVVEQEIPQSRNGGEIARSMQAFAEGRRSFGVECLLDLPISRPDHLRFQDDGVHRAPHHRLVAAVNARQYDVVHFVVGVALVGSLAFLQPLRPLRQPVRSARFQRRRGNHGAEGEASAQAQRKERFRDVCFRDAPHGALAGAQRADVAGAPPVHVLKLSRRRRFHGDVRTTCAAPTGRRGLGSTRRWG